MSEQEANVARKQVQSLKGPVDIYSPMAEEQVGANSGYTRCFNILSVNFDS